MRLKNLLLFIIIFFVFFGCKKYYPENDRAYLFYKQPLKKHLLGTWKFDKYIASGVDSTFWVNDSIKCAQIKFTDECFKNTYTGECLISDRDGVEYKIVEIEIPCYSLKYTSQYYYKRNYSSIREKLEVNLTFLGFFMTEKNPFRQSGFRLISKITKNEMLIQQPSTGNKISFIKLKD